MTFLRVGLEPSFVSRVMHGELVIDSKTDETDQLKFQQWERELRKSNRTDERAARLEVEARMLRFARVGPKRATDKTVSAAIASGSVGVLHCAEIPTAADIHVHR